MKRLISQKSVLALAEKAGFSLGCNLRMSKNQIGGKLGLADVDVNGKRVLMRYEAQKGKDKIGPLTIVCCPFFELCSSSMRNGKFLKGY